jgi:hypothetical protein
LMECSCEEPCFDFSFVMMYKKQFFKPPMKTKLPLFIFSILILLSSVLFAQVGIGTNKPAASAALEVTSESNAKGLLIPRLTDAQRSAIKEPAEGLLIYQTSAPAGFYFFTNGEWKLIISQTNGKDLSSNDYTTAEKTKLAAITGSNTGDQTTITGNAGTATKLTTTRNINGVAFDGSADITIAAAASAEQLTGTTLKPTITGSSLTSVGTLGSLTVTNPIVGSVTGNAATATNLTGLTTSVATLNTLSGTNSGDQTTITGNAATATKLATTRNINGVAFDGSADITIAAAASAEDLTGTTLKSTVTSSSLTSVGTLGSLTVSNPIVGSVTGNAATATSATTATTAGNITATSNSTLTSLANLATVGTINSGVWNGTAVAVEKGGTGATTVSAARTNLGLANVDNTSDINKQVSAATQAAIDFKLSKTDTIPMLSWYKTSLYQKLNKTDTVAMSNRIDFKLNKTDTTAMLSSYLKKNGTWSGTAIAIGKGGTGATTKSAGFDALSPMTTSGDIIYGGTSGTGTRLGKGSDGQVLTLASGVPSWATPSGGAVHTIGEAYGGGIVFYVTSDGLHGLIAETQDQSSTSSNWNEAQDIISNSSNHSAAGRLFTDWRLPTKHELNLMYTNIGQGAPPPNTNIGGFVGSAYWSSTKITYINGSYYAYNNAWYQNFGNGGMYNWGDVENTSYVRAIRAF